MGIRTTGVVSFSQNKSLARSQQLHLEVKMPLRAPERINFGKIKEVIAPPNMIEVQINSYREFLQAELPPSRRKNIGLQAVFTEVFPIESYDGKSVLDYHSYEIGEPKQDWLECLREGI